MHEIIFDIMQITIASSTALALHFLNMFALLSGCLRHISGWHLRSLCRCVLRLPLSLQLSLLYLAFTVGIVYAL